ncbi:MAG: hypothetical protein E6J11_20035, partial [Chloroflexi bacterium]
TLVLEHGFLADATQRARAIRLGIPVTIQHPLLYTLASVLLESWGQERTREIMPVRAWLEEGASLSAGTDHPVSSFNPLLSLWGMVTRGTLKAGIQGSEYAIDQYTAVHLYTLAGAQLNGESHRRGTLEPRRLADLVAFRSNPITCPIDDLPSLRPVFTMVGGRAVGRAYLAESPQRRYSCSRFSFIQAASASSSACKALSRVAYTMRPSHIIPPLSRARMKER